MYYYIFVMYPPFKINENNYILEEWHTNIFLYGNLCVKIIYKC